MRTPENLADVMRRLNEAAELLKSAALAAERNLETKPIGVRLLKMSDEAGRYGQYIAAYFSASPIGRN
jgi:hypothetical protein